MMKRMRPLTTEPVTIQRPMQFLHPTLQFHILATSEAIEVRNSLDTQEDDLNGLLMEIKTKTENLFAIAASGSPMSFLNEKRHRDYEQTTVQQHSSIFYRRTAPGT